MNALEELNLIAQDDGDVAVRALRVRDALQELLDAADAVAHIQINRRSPANDMGKAKQLRLRAAIDNMRGGKR